MSPVNARASRIDRSVTSAMLRSPIVTASVSGRRRWPLHARHGISRMNCSSFSRAASDSRSEEHTSELQSRLHLVCRLLLEKKKKQTKKSKSPTKTLNEPTKQKN